jgi:hypothetical protein
MINLDLNNKQEVYSKTVTSKDNSMQIELLSSKSPYKLTLKEYRFLSSINSKTEISYKQRDWLKIIYKKLLKYDK